MTTEYLKLKLSQLKELVKNAGMPIDGRLDLRCKVTWLYLCGLEIYPKYKVRFKHTISNPWWDEQPGNPFTRNYTTNPQRWWNEYSQRNSRTKSSSNKENPHTEAKSKQKNTRTKVKSKPVEKKSAFGREDVYTTEELFRQFKRVFKVSLHNIDRHRMKQIYRQLSKKHHPDVGGVPQDFRFITNLYERAQDYVAA